MNEVDHRRLIPQSKPRYGRLTDGNTFTVEGDWQKALEALKKALETSEDFKSEPIKPITQKELKAEKNKPIQSFVDDLPPISVT